MTSGSSALDKSDINIMLFDAKAKPQATVGAIELSGANANKGEQGVAITPPDKRGQAVYLSASYREADKPEPGKVAKVKIEERALHVGWNPQFEGWWPGDTHYQVSKRAWALGGGGCNDLNSWRELPDPDKTLGIAPANKGEHIGLDIFKGKRPDNTYAIKLALNVADSGKPRSMGGWALVEQDAPAALRKALQSKEPIPSRSLGTLNLDRLVDGVWFQTRDAARGQGEGGPYQFRTDTLVVKKAN